MYCQREDTKRKRRKSGPHHNLEFYKGDFDGVTGDDIMRRPYARYDNIVDWKMIEAQLARNGRVSLICYDVV